jgi:uracil-DNA glycosylase family 4
MNSISRRARSLATLEKLTVACTACPRLISHCRKIARAKKKAFQDQNYWGKPVPGFGDPNARLVIVGLAPAAHGANRTGRVFTGDSSGDWLYGALHQYEFASQVDSISISDGMKLHDAWITSAARCAPPDNKPSSVELSNCRPFLARELQLLTQMRIVITLGKIGFEAWLKASGWWDQMGPGRRPRFTHGGETLMPGGLRLITSYHPSRQNTNTGRLTRRMWHAVFSRARKRLTDIP